MTLLRAYDNCGIDVSDIYDPDNILDVKKKQLQEDILDNSNLEEIQAEKNKVEAILLHMTDAPEFCNNVMRCKILFLIDI